LDSFRIEGRYLTEPLRAANLSQSDELAAEERLCKTGEENKERSVTTSDTSSKETLAT
jgi:hypothetical protein